ncbi:hypothetical protein, partial [Klebsiella pneumoniae]|uniref:hypothetical protein n=1 Tax=Klebsiella pneumoniae TaxID=573 RepID=UPI0038CC1259
ANQEIRKEREAYDNFGGYATDPKLMMDPNMVAEDGLKDTKKGVIEIEAKRGIGEIHTDKDFNIKTIGTTPHSQGGDKTVATDGDIV